MRRFTAHGWLVDFMRLEDFIPRRPVLRPLAICVYF